MSEVGFGRMGLYPVGRNGIAVAASFSNMPPGHALARRVERRAPKRTQEFGPANPIGYLGTTLDVTKISTAPAAALTGTEHYVIQEPETLQVGNGAVEMEIDRVEVPDVPEHTVVPPESGPVPELAPEPAHEPAANPEPAPAPPTSSAAAGPGASKPGYINERLSGFSLADSWYIASEVVEEAINHLFADTKEREAAIQRIPADIDDNLKSYRVLK